MESGSLFKSKNTTLKFYYLSNWLTDHVVIFGTHLKMQLILSTPSLNFFCFKNPRKKNLDICNWNNLVWGITFRNISTIEKDFTWFHRILVVLPITLFAIIDIIYLFFCRMFPLHFFDFFFWRMIIFHVEDKVELIIPSDEFGILHVTKKCLFVMFNFW